MIVLTEDVVNFMKINNFKSIIIDCKFNCMG